MDTLFLGILNVVPCCVLRLDALIKYFKKQKSPEQLYANYKVIQLLRKEFNLK